MVDPYIALRVPDPIHKRRYDKHSWNDVQTLLVAYPPEEFDVMAAIARPYLRTDT
jgi:hypothetical protein